MGSSAAKGVPLTVLENRTSKNRANPQKLRTSPVSTDGRDNKEHSYDEQKILDFTMKTISQYTGLQSVILDQGFHIRVKMEVRFWSLQRKLPERCFWIWQISWS